MGPGNGSHSSSGDSPLAQGNPGKGSPKEPDSVAPDPKVLKENETDIKHHVERLAELAQQLKKQVEETDSTKVLSLDMLKKTQEIEKLAHQIATLARG